MHGALDSTLGSLAESAFRRRADKKNFTKSWVEPVDRLSETLWRPTLAIIARPQLKRDKRTVQETVFRQPRSHPLARIGRDMNIEARPLGGNTSGPVVKIDKIEATLSPRELARPEVGHDFTTNGPAPIGCYKTAANVSRRDRGGQKAGEFAMGQVQCEVKRLITETPDKRFEPTHGRRPGVGVSCKRLEDLGIRKEHERVVERRRNRHMAEGVADHKGHVCVGQMPPDSTQHWCGLENVAEPTQLEHQQPLHPDTPVT